MTAQEILIGTSVLISNKTPQGVFVILCYILLMILEETPKRVAIFIDNSNVLLTIKKLQRAGEWHWNSLFCPKYLSEKLVGTRNIVYIGFYCAPPPAFLVKGDHADQNRYRMAMKYYSLIEKTEGVTVHYATVNGTRGNLQEKNLDTKLTADMVGMAAKNEFDTAILVSNDADFVSAVTTIQSLGRRSEVIYFKGLCSMNLRQKTDLARKAKPSFFKKIDGFDSGVDKYIPRAEPPTLFDKK